MRGSHIAQLFSTTLLAYYLGGFEIGRIKEQSDKELRRWRASGEIAINGNHSVDWTAARQESRHVATAGLGKKEFSHLVAIPQAGYAARDGTRSYGDYLPGFADGPAQIVHILIGAHATAYQEHIDLWYVVGRDDQGHVDQPVLVDPLTSVEERHLASRTARKL